MKIQALGLNSAYKDNKWLKFTFGLTFLDPNEVSDCFVEDFIHEIPDDPKYREYADYLLDNYYIGENSNFSPNIWAAFTADLTRTTNNCESFHSHFNEQFYKSHPNIFTFLEILTKTVQTDDYLKSIVVLKIYLTQKKKFTN
uniref:MULE transposase domain-containing protein n=1 Tax=Schizaphis graminum TaxID=13262 RepID=A0A2S2NZ79_SCHGA